MKCLNCKSDKVTTDGEGRYTCTSCGYEWKAGEVREFETGAIRDSEVEKEDYVETISWRAMRRYAQYMTGKKSKYGAGNFKKGIPIDSYERSMLRHISKYMINKYEGGDLEKNEDHLSAACFNILGIMHEEGKNESNE